MLEQLLAIFPGIGTLFVQDPVIAISRLALIVLGFVLAYLGFKRTLEPLIMVPMGLGMMAVNAGVMFLEAGKIGTLIIAPMVSDTSALIEVMQIDFLQPVYNFTFTNSLIACLLFMGIGTMADISFVLARPWASVTVAIFAELGTFATLVIGYYCGLTPAQARRGRIDRPVPTARWCCSPRWFWRRNSSSPSPSSPTCIFRFVTPGTRIWFRWLVGRKFRGLEVEFEFPEVSQRRPSSFSQSSRRPFSACCSPWLRP